MSSVRSIPFAPEAKDLQKVDAPLRHTGKNASYNGTSNNQATDALSTKIIEVIEVLICCTALTGMALVWPSLGGQPEILLLVYLFGSVGAALYYRNGTAVLACLLAALNYSALVQWNFNIHQVASSFHIIAGPFIIAAGGIVVSRLVRSMRERLEQAESHFITLRTTTTDITSRYQQLLAINEDFERQIANQQVSLLSLSDRIIALFQPGSEEKIESILQLVAHVTDARTCSFYYFDGDHLQYVTSVTPIDEQVTEFLAPQNPLVRRLLNGQLVSHIRESLPSGMTIPLDLHNAVLMIGAIKTPNNKIWGLITVEQLSVRRYTVTTVQQFTAVIQLITHLANAMGLVPPYSENQQSLIEETHKVDRVVLGKK
jgi:hypothetical protein